MALIRKQDIAAPVLPRETVAVPALGGEVVVRGMLFSERAALAQRIARNGTTFTEIPEFLAVTVLDGDDAPLFSVAAWDAFGVAHPSELSNLFDVARRLSGFDAEDAEKN